MKRLLSSSRLLPKNYRIFVVALEPSGDAIAARVMATLRDIHGNSFEFSGVGGSVSKRLKLLVHC